MIADIRVPDSGIVRQAEELARSLSSGFPFNHVMPARLWRYRTGRPYRATGRSTNKQQKPRHPRRERVARDVAVTTTELHH